VVVALARMKQDLAVLLERAGLLDRIGREHCYPTLPTAVAAYRAAVAGADAAPAPPEPVAAPDGSRPAVDGPTGGSGAPGML
jgi:hypothetical protein